MKRVFLLWHTHELRGDGADEKLIGVYESRVEAERAKERVAGLPGFSLWREGFEVVEYEVGKDHWTEGFVGSHAVKKSSGA